MSERSGVDIGLLWDNRRCGTCLYFSDDPALHRCVSPVPLSVNAWRDRVEIGPNWIRCPTWTPADRAARIALLKAQIAELEKEA